MPALTILCATRAEPRFQPYLEAMRDLATSCGAAFSVVLDGGTAAMSWLSWGIPTTAVSVATHGVHVPMGELVEDCGSEYVLMLDDDEYVSDPLADWLRRQQYRGTDFWRIPRAWLWPDPHHHLVTPKHWPDYQLRLGRSAFVRVPTVIHGGWIAPVEDAAIAPPALEHHKLLLRSRSEREATVAAYEAVQSGAGMPTVYLPEDLPHTIEPWPRP